MASLDWSRCAAVESVPLGQGRLDVAESLGRLAYFRERRLAGPGCRRRYRSGTARRRESCGQANR